MSRGARAWLTSSEPKSQIQARLGAGYRLWTRLAQSPMGLVGLFIIAIVLLAAILAPVLPLEDPLAQLLTRRLQPPSARHWFGTDGLGRDLFSRTVWGARPTFFIVAVILLLTAPVGLLTGAAAGLWGGAAERVLMRVCDVFMAFPRLVLALATAAVLGAEASTMILAISLTAWTPYARIARAEAAAVRNSDFLAAARMLGASKIRLLIRHVMPLCLPSTVIRMALDAPGIILIVSGLGFLGLGLEPPTPEWGAIVADGRAVIFEAYWVSTLPGLAIFFSGLAFNLFGDALRDALDPGEA